MTRRTKIICTLGPSTDNEAVMRALIEEGMNVARFNFSHGPHDEQMIFVLLVINSSFLFMVSFFKCSC